MPKLAMSRDSRPTYQDILGNHLKNGSGILPQILLEILRTLCQNPCLIKTHILKNSEQSRCKHYSVDKSKKKRKKKGCGLLSL